MRRLPILAFALVSLIAFTFAMRTLAQNAPGGSPPQNGGADGGAGGPGGQGN